MHLGHARNAGGFTLIELVVTMIVLAILMMMAVPSFNDFFDRSRLRGAADDVVSVISQARAEAVKTDRDVNVSFEGSGAGWCVGANAALDPGSTGAPAAGQPVPAAAACDCQVATQCQVSGQRLAVNVGRHGDVSLVTAAPTAMTFSRKLGVLNPLGSPITTLSSPTRTYRLDIRTSALGQTRLCVPDDWPSMAGVPSC